MWCASYHLYTLESRRQLLPEAVELALHIAAALVGVDLDVIAHAVRRMDAHHASHRAAF